MLCTVAHYKCTVGSGWGTVVPSDIVSCNTSDPVVVFDFDCDLPSASPSASVVVASPSADFSVALSDFFRVSIVSYGLILFCLFYFIAIKFFKR